MAGEAEHRDPADIARERNEEVAILLAQAAVLEEKPTANVSDYTEANNLRLRALCIHLRLPVLEVNGKEPER